MTSDLRVDRRGAARGQNLGLWAREKLGWDSKSKDRGVRASHDIFLVMQVTVRYVRQPVNNAHVSYFVNVPLQAGYPGIYAG